MQMVQSNTGLEAFYSGRQLLLSAVMRYPSGSSLTVEGLPATEPPINSLAVRCHNYNSETNSRNCPYTGFSPEANEIPATDCGGVVDTYGGSITMSNMTTFESGNPVLYDCVWLIKPLIHESVIRTHLQLLFEQFSSLGIYCFSNFYAKQHL